MKELIKDINSVLKNGVLVMSIEVKPSVINSIHIVKYNFYIIQPNTNKKEVLTLSRTVKTSELHTLGDLIKRTYAKVDKANKKVYTIEGNTSNNTDAAISDKFMAEVEQAIFNKVNEERTKAGVAPLTYNTTMEKYARIKSQDMGDNNYFSHTDLNGNNITAKMKADGVTYKAWGENIAYIAGVTDPTALANQFMTNWMNSQGHKENILSTKFSSIGVGVYKIGNKVYATQEFYR